MTAEQHTVEEASRRLYLQLLDPWQAANCIAHAQADHSDVLSLLDAVCAHGGRANNMFGRESSSGLFGLSDDI